MNFKADSQEELIQKNIVDGNEYQIEYVNKDYFNGDETIEKATAKAIINEGEILFIVPDPFGMEKFINSVRVIM